MLDPVSLVEETFAKKHSMNADWSLHIVVALDQARG
jgi:hypothetical protein